MTVSNRGASNGPNVVTAAAHRMSPRLNGGTSVAPDAKAASTVTTSSCVSVATTAASAPTFAATRRRRFVTVRVSEDAEMPAIPAFVSVPNRNAKRSIVAAAKFSSKEANNLPRAVGILLVGKGDTAAVMATTAVTAEVITADTAEASTTTVGTTIGVTGEET